MTVYGIDDNESMIDAERPNLGHLRKGGPKGPKSIGEDLLDHFRYEGPPALQQIFRQAYGEWPNFIRGYLAYADLLAPDGSIRIPASQRNLQIHMKYYQGGKLVRLCDRRIISQERKDAKSPLLPCAIECPGLARGGCGQCRTDVKLYFCVTEFLAYGPLPVIAHSTAVHDALRLTKHLAAIQEDHGAILGLPLILYRTPETVPNPFSSQRNTEWLLNLTVDETALSNHPTRHLPIPEKMIALGSAPWAIKKTAHIAAGPLSEDAPPEFPKTISLPAIDPLPAESPDGSSEVTGISLPPVVSIQRPALDPLSEFGESPADSNSDATAIMQAGADAYGLALPVIRSMVGWMKLKPEMINPAEFLVVIRRCQPVAFAHVNQQTAGHYKVLKHMMNALKIMEWPKPGGLEWDALIAQAIAHAQEEKPVLPDNGNESLADPAPEAALEGPPIPTQEELLADFADPANETPYNDW